MIKPAIEEVLRFNSAQTSWRRVTTKDTEFRGIKLPKGTEVFMSLAAANRDPRLFDHPDRYDMDRDNASKHIAFGRGPHICLGRLLAKLELTTVLNLLIEKVRSAYSCASNSRSEITSTEPLPRYQNVSASYRALSCDHLFSSAVPPVE